MFVVPVKNIRKIDENTLTFSVYYKYKDYVINKLDNYKTEWRIVKETGLPVILSKLFKRPGLILGLFLSVILIFFSTFLIFDITVTGNTYVSDSDIIRTLSDIGIAEGKIKNKKVLEDKYNEFLLKENRISWISVNFDGTVGYVEVDEREIIPERLDENKIINIVAKSDGVIKRLDVLRGKGEVFAGETVEKGQLLISSFVTSDITNGYVNRARGFAWAQTEKCYDIYIKKNSVTKEIKNTRKYDYLNFIGKTIPCFLFKNKESDVYKTSYDYKNLLLFDKFKLPFYITSEERQIYKFSNTDISKDQALIFAENKINEIITEKSSVINKEYTLSENDNWYIFKYNILCIEDIGKEIALDFN